MFKLWNKIQKHRGNLTDSSRERGLFLGLLFSLFTLFFGVDSDSKVGSVIAVIYSAYQLSSFYMYRNKR
jgi:hypothetical protein